MEIDPKYTRALTNKSNVLSELGNHKEATECYDKALEIEPKNVDAWNMKGLALFELGKYDAIECYDKALEIDPKQVLVLHNKR